MAEHDFRYTLLNPQYTLNECRALSPGRYQVTGTGGSIKADDVLLVSLKGSKTLSMRLTVEKVRHLINPPGQWLAVARGRRPVCRGTRVGVKPGGALVPAACWGAFVCLRARSDRLRPSRRVRTRQRYNCSSAGRRARGSPARPRPSPARRKGCT